MTPKAKIQQQLQDFQRQEQQFLAMANQAAGAIIALEAVLGDMEEAVAGSGPEPDSSSES